MLYERKLTFLINKWYSLISKYIYSFFVFHHMGTTSFIYFHF